MGSKLRASLCLIFITLGVSPSKKKETTGE
jgi:hypothetical protein